MSLSLSQALPEDEPLAPLRQDLRIERGAPLASGAAGWVIHDPVRHRYFQVGREVLDILAEWPAGSIGRLRAVFAQRHGRTPDAAEIRSVAAFLVGHELTSAPPGGAAALARRERERQHHWLAWLVHNYLFFRVPLVRPQRFLEAAAPVARLLFSAPVLALFAGLALLAILLVARRWDSFVATGVSFFTLEGLVASTVTLAAVKSIHELGHALMATRHGVKVPTMGVAFMVMTPFLYSEVSDAWRLPSRRAKLAIDCAGMLAEFMLAVLALIAWVFLPDGLLREAAFLVAATSIVASVFLNMNPFMRFDGYHILADALGVPNLQTRAMAVGRWALREFLFAPDAPPPERLSRRGLAAMAAYAYSIWIYRFFLFLGIALLVYHMAFKALGVVLFLIEIVWFILRPVALELKVVWLGRAVLLRRGRTWLTAACVAGAAAALLVPWSGTVTVPAMTGARVDALVFPPAPARIVRLVVQEGQAVEKGDTLAVLEAPDLTFERVRVRERISLLRLRLARLPADGQDRAERLVLSARLDSEEQAEAGLSRQIEELVLRAPDDGIVRELDPNLRTGVWLGSRAPLLRVVGHGEGEVRGYIREDDLRRLRPGATGRFVPEDPQSPSFPVVLQDIGRAGVEALDLPALAVPYEGPLAAVEDSRRRLVPSVAVYPAMMQPQPAAAVLRATRGRALLEGVPESLASRVVRQVVAVLIRESGA